MKYKLNFLLLVIAVGVISTLLHELGHCIFYWIQGIPAGMSLVMEYPLIDITATQYGIGSLGGPIVNIVLIIGSFYLIRKHEKKSIKWTIYSAIIIANTFYFIFRSIIAIKKNYGGEIESIMNLAGLNFYPAVILFLVLSLSILVWWVYKFKLKISFTHILFYFMLFILYLAVHIIMENIDSNFFKDKFPTIKIDNVKTHNPHK
ncbi:MAG: hypothetical protein KKG99_04935 [Bacteroidetes bacterium]|nr:hypothetical protein [Bacteroidota bacterium]